MTTPWYAYLSRFSQPSIEVNTYNGATIVDADGDSVIATMLKSDGTQIFQRAATKTATGTYHVTLSSYETATQGTFEVQFRYATSGTQQIYVAPIEVGEADPAYDSLGSDFKGIIETVWPMFADGFDTPTGGLYLQTLYQSGFGRGRMAQLLGLSLSKLNVSAQPTTTYTLDGVGGPLFPIAAWGGLLSQMLTVEIIKHIIRAYTEQPDPRNVTLAFLDRRDYITRWQTSLQAEMETLKPIEEVFRIRHMGLGAPSVLVAGGAYGRWTEQRFANASIRPRTFIRYY
jgi:hypothetical protein